MADNIGISAGSDATVATEDVSGVHHQKVKVEYGADGAATLVETVAPLPMKPGTPVTGDLSAASVNASSSGENALIAGTTSQTIRVFRLLLTFAAACNVKFKDAAGGTDLTGDIPMKPGGSIVLDFDGEPWFKTASGGAFIMNLSAAVQVSGRVYYTKS